MGTAVEIEHEHAVADVKEVCGLEESEEGVDRVEPESVNPV